MCMLQNQKHTTRELYSVFCKQTKNLKILKAHILSVLSFHISMWHFIHIFIGLPFSSYLLIYVIFPRVLKRRPFNTSCRPIHPAVHHCTGLSRSRLQLCEDSEYSDETQLSYRQLSRAGSVCEVIIAIRAHSNQSRLHVTADVTAAIWMNEWRQQKIIISHLSRFHPCYRLRPFIRSRVISSVRLFSRFLL